MTSRSCLLPALALHVIDGLGLVCGRLEADDFGLGLGRVEREPAVEDSLTRYEKVRRTGGMKGL